MASAVVCNKCGEMIDKSRLRDYTLVCNNCGMIHSPRETLAKRSVEGSILKGQIIAILLVVGLFAHIRNWDTYFISILPAKVKQMANVASIDDHKYIVQACAELKKLDCVADNLGHIAELNPRNLQAQKQHGMALFKAKRHAEAAVVLGNYFSLNGKDIKTAIAYAESLDISGELKKAERMYRWVLNKRKNVLQISLSEKYVRLLMKRGKFFTAKSMIKYIQKRSVKSPNFMMKELKKVDASINLAKK